MKKIILSSEDYLIDFEVLAIQSNIENEVAFIYQFNKYFDTKFSKDNSLDVYHEKQKFCYSVFTYINTESFENYKLYKNRPNLKRVTNEIENPSLFDLFQLSPFLIPSCKSFNYLLKVPIGLEQNELYLKLKVLNDLISKIKIVENTSKKVKNLLS